MFFGTSTECSCVGFSVLIDKQRTEYKTARMNYLNFKPVLSAKSFETLRVEILSLHVSEFRYLLEIPNGELGIRKIRDRYETFA